MPHQPRPCSSYSNTGETKTRNPIFNLSKKILLSRGVLSSARTGMIAYIQLRYCLDWTTSQSHDEVFKQIFAIEAIAASPSNQCACKKADQQKADPRVPLKYTFTVDLCSQ
eukprot:2352791-Amphidinium_carterae.1